MEARNNKRGEEVMPRKKKAPNKTEFVREFAKETPVKNIVAEAKRQGFSISPAHVHSIRSKVKTESKPDAGGVLPAEKKAKDINADNIFRQFILEIGLTRAKALIVEVEGLLK